MMNPPREDMSRLANLDDFIAYCESTPEESWTCDVVRTKTNQNCLFGHLVDWFYGPEYTGVISGAWDYFEEMWASTFMVYPINDPRRSDVSEGWRNGRGNGGRHMLRMPLRRPYQYQTDWCPACTAYVPYRKRPSER